VYSPQVLDHFEHPRNAGVLDSPDATATVENPACGDVLKLYARVSGERIAEAKFQAKGCVPAIACGSVLTELISGKTFAEAGRIRRQDLLRKISNLPEASQHASHLAMDALGALLKAVGHQSGRVRSGQ
jgi:NifU-like protein involved in Fe-S cluster formation